MQTPQSFCAIGLINPKSPSNVGSVLRAAGCYSASQVLYTGQRYSRAAQFATDTQNRHSEIPLNSCDNFFDALPESIKVVAFELVEGATPLPHFKHPEDALYIFGPEDGSIDQSTLNRCDHVIYVPTIGCMNLAASVNVVLYDRLAKNKTTAYGDEIIISNRDTNNNTRVIHHHY